MDNRTVFNDLRGRLGLPLEALAPILGRSHGTLKRYAAAKGGLVPPDAVIERMRDVLVRRAVDDLEAAGITLNQDVLPGRQETRINVHVGDKVYTGTTIRPSRSCAGSIPEKSFIE